MSHFSVIVIGDVNDIDAQMAPYAEQDFEEQYGVFNDTEDENLEEYQNKDVDIVVLSDGSLFSKYDHKFRHFDSQRLSSDYVYPEDSVIRKGKFSELYPTFEDYMSDWHGMKSRDEETGRYGYWHNPNAKWDWYSIGGRWTGYFKPKDGTEGDLGRPGAFGNKPLDGWVDSLRLCDIDFDAMKAHAVKEANEAYDKLEAVLKGRPLPSWNVIREKHGENIDLARAEYHGMKVVQELNDAQIWAMGDLVEVFGHSREEYVERCKNRVAVPYAVVKDGQWYEKGRMGWFGVSHGDMNEDDWNKQFWNMLGTLDPETTLTLVDCHI